MSDFRKKSYLLNISSSLFANVLAIIAGIIIVPLALNYWHEETYGVWILITTFVSYLSLSNLGLSSAVTTLVSKSLSIVNKINILKRATLIMIGYLVVILGLISAINAVGADWGFLLGKASLGIRDQAYTSCTVMVFFFIFNLIFSLLSAALIGFQKAYIENLFQATVPMVNLAALLIVIHFKGSIVSFALYSGIGTTAINFVKLIVVLVISKKLMFDHVVKVNNSDLGEGYYDIIITGLRFFLMSIAVLLWWNTDNIVIAKYLGMDDVTRYSITFKLFAIAYSFMNLIGSALSPILAREYSLENWQWINKIYLFATAVLAFIGGLICIGGILFTNEIIVMWTGGSGYAGLTVVTILGIYTYFLSANNIDAGIINTCNYTKGIAWVYLLSSSVKFLISLLLIKVLGLAGVALGTLAASALITSWLFPLWIKRHSKGMINAHPLATFKNFLPLIPFVMVSILVSIYIKTGTIEKYTVGILILVGYFMITYFLTSKENIEYGLKVLKNVK